MPHFSASLDQLTISVQNSKITVIINIGNPGLGLLIKIRKE
jgi:hypothetical protein